MKTKLCSPFLVLALFAGVNHVAAQGTAFTYQGRLNDGSNPAGGTYNLTFSLFTNNAGGVAIAGPVTTNGVGVTNGLFTVTIDFGAAAFNGQTNWLQIGVETNGAGSFTTLSPLQELTPAPYAVFAENAGALGSLLVQQNADGAPNLIGGSRNNFVAGGVVGATIGGGGAVNYDGASYTNSATGDFGTVGGGLGNQTGGDGATVGGGFGNDASGVDATIGGGALNVAGGGGLATVGGGYRNQATNNWAAVAGGYGNIASGPGAFVGGGGADGLGDQGGNLASGPASVVGGGLNNQATNIYATVAGGADNVAGGGYSTIGGGGDNQTPNSGATVAGGYFNNASGIGAFIGGGGVDGVDDFAGNQASGTASVIGGGYGNQATNNFATVVGGYLNTASGVAAFVGGGGDDGEGDYSPNVASGGASAIGGGLGNVASGVGAYVGGGYGNQATNFFATVAGGYQNIAGGSYSFAAGFNAQALHVGSFVWADGQLALFSDAGTNSFNIRAAGGVFLDSSTPAINFGGATRQMLNLFGTGYGIGVQNYTEYFRTANGFAWYLNGSHNNNQTNSGGGSTLMVLTSGGLTVNGTLASASDRNAKQDFAAVNPREVLDRVTALPITEWTYKMDAGTRHIGPMAQDFYAAFDVGPDDRHITTVDEGGVALAAIQGLNQKLNDKDAEIQDLKARLAKLEQLLTEKK